MFVGHLVEVEDDVELADVGELLVQQLDEQVDGLEPEQLVGREVHAQDEEESGVAAVDEFVVAELDEVGVLGVARHDEAVDLGLQSRLLLVLGRRHVPLGQPRLALAVLQQEEADLSRGTRARVRM